MKPSKLATQQKGRGRVDERPFVAVYDQTRPCVVLWRARKYVYAVEYSGGVRITKTSVDTFDRDYKLLRPRVNGSVDDSREYDVQEAARKYLAWGSYAGITDGARTALQTILDRKGSLIMSDIEKTAEAQGDAKVPAPKVAEDSGLVPAVPKTTSTKNGTTPEAKRPSKATTTKTKEKTMAKEATKAKAPAKKEAPKAPAKKEAPKAPAKKEAPKAKAPEKLTTKAATAKAADGRGRPSTLDASMTIRVMVEKGVNPRREGSKGYENWGTIVKHDGKTVGKYLEMGGKADNLRADVARGHVKLVK